MAFFSIFSFINLVFLGLLGLATVRLCRAEQRGIALLAMTLKLEVAYFLIGSMVFLLPMSLGQGVASGLRRW